MSGKRHKHEKQNKNANHQNGTGQQNPNDGGGIMRVQGEVETNPAPTVIDKHDAERREDKAYERKKFVAEVLSLVVLAIYAGITLYSAYLTREIASISRDQARASKDALESVQRAFVTFQGLDTEIVSPTEGAGDKVWSVGAHWENSGTTIARVMDKEFSIQPLPHEPDGEIFIGKAESHGGSIVVGAKAPLIAGPIAVEEKEVLPNIPKSAKAFQEIRVAQRTYFWGWLAYRDIFPDTKVHISEFCAYPQSATIGRDTSTGRPVARVSYGACKTHNCNDEDCGDYKQIIELLSKKSQAPSKP